MRASAIARRGGAGLPEATIVREALVRSKGGPRRAVRLVSDGTMRRATSALS